MCRWVHAPRDDRGGGEQQLSENVVRNLKHLIPKLPVPVPRPGRTRVVISFVDGGQWITCGYSSEALPEPLASIFRFLDFNVYGAARMARGLGLEVPLGDEARKPLRPAVRVADFQHHVEDRVPSLRLFELRIGEHAAIPADVFDATRGGIFEPVAGAFHDV